MHVRDTIARSLADEPQSVIKVAQTDTLRTDVLEYVLTDGLAREFVKVLEPVIESARPASKGMDHVGIWISGFFGSGKSHFAKLAGHLLANTPIGNDTTRALFQPLLHTERTADRQVQELLQQAAMQQLVCHLVIFDITALHTAAAEQNVGLTFLRAFHQSLGLSNIPAFAERELELQAAGRYEAFLQLYKEKTNHAWQQDKDLTLWSARFAECLAELLPDRFPTTQLAHESLTLGMKELADLSIDGVVTKILHWLDVQQRTSGKGPRQLIFVADEVGAWAGDNLNRIEGLRTLVEMLGTRGHGRIWLMVTSQEKLSAVVQNTTTDDRHLLQRLEAAFGSTSTLNQAKSEP